MTQKSSDQLMESLSALVDGEASELEMRRALKALDGNEELQSAWSRYNLIGSVMRKEVSDSGMDLSASIRAAIDTDSDHEVIHVDSTSDVDQTQKADRRWLGWLGKSSVAASVAAVFVVGAGQIANPVLTDQTPAHNSIASTASSTPSTPSNTLSAPLGFELPAVESRSVVSTGNNVLVKPVVQSGEMSAIEAKVFLNQLRLQHAKRASLNGDLGLMPFARVSEVSENQNP